MATSHRSPRHVFGAALAGARDVELRDAATDPVPEHRLGATRVIIGATGVAAAVALSWSLNLEPGQALFYPATFLVAVIYGAGIFAAGRVGAILGVEGAEFLQDDLSRVEQAFADGVRVLTDDGWWLLRASNTQAVLVARAEARDDAGLDRLKAALAGQLQESGLEAPDFSGENAGH